MQSVFPLLITPAVTAGAESYVLLVDDHEPSLRRLDELLRNSGHRCIAARSGAEALACCDSRRPRVVVTDLAMPDLDGRGLARWLQSRCPSVPIILMTGQVFGPGSLDELERTFTAVLPKPIDVDRLLKLLDRIMPPRAKPHPDTSRP
jgi:CheY-like chemotaxis protein